jgi:hypothetical protein
VARYFHRAKLICGNSQEFCQFADAVGRDQETIRWISIGVIRDENPFRHSHSPVNTVKSHSSLAPINLKDPCVTRYSGTKKSCGRHVPWAARVKVDESRQALIASGLFSTVRITPASDPDNPGQVRMTIDVTERSHRSIGAGVAYNTSQGPAARAFWENRNLFGNAEYLRLAVEGGQQIAGFSANFRHPIFWRRISHIRYSHIRYRCTCHCGWLPALAPAFGIWST